MKKCVWMCKYVALQQSQRNYMHIIYYHIQSVCKLYFDKHFLVGASYLQRATVEHSVCLPLSVTF